MYLSTVVMTTEGQTITVQNSSAYLNKCLSTTLTEEMVDGVGPRQILKRTCKFKHRSFYIQTKRLSILETQTLHV